MSAYDPAYAKRWRYDRDHGITRMADSHQTRMHIASLLGAGWSQRAIAGAASVSPAVVNRLATGGQTQVRRTIAAQILAVEIASVPSRPSRQTAEPFVSRVGAVRRIQALLWMGWTHQAMREVCGLRTALVLSQQGRWITRASHDRVAAMYRELSMRPGPSTLTADRAKKLGYLGPMAWDDIDHDPAPDPVIGECSAGHTLTEANTYEYRDSEGRLRHYCNDCHRQRKAERRSAA